jgi:hypothetical protein
MILIRCGGNMRKLIVVLSILACLVACKISPIPNSHPLSLQWYRIQDEIEKLEATKDTLNPLYQHCMDSLRHELDKTVSLYEYINK